MTKEKREWVTISEAVKLTGVSRSFIYQKVVSNEFKSTKVGNQYLIKLETIKRLKPSYILENTLSGVEEEFTSLKNIAEKLGVTSSAASYAFTMKKYLRKIYKIKKKQD